MARSATLLYVLLTVLTLGASARPSGLLASTGHVEATRGHSLGTLGQGSPLSLSVYPNPARGQTNVLLTLGNATDYQLRLSNVLGSEVRRLSVRPESQPTDGFKLDLDGLPPGLYFCSLLSGEKTLATKRLTVL